MARFLLAMSAAMAAVTVVACSPGSSANESCKTTADCQAQLVCLWNPGVCKPTCTTSAQCSNGETCQCSGVLLHCDPPMPDAGCGG
jgi:hypothetical protein